MATRSNQNRMAMEIEYNHQTRWNEGMPAATDNCGSIEFEIPISEAKLKHFSAGDIIYRQRGSSDTLYAIEWGLVKLLCYLPNGRARIVRLHGQGDWVGLEALLRQPYEQTAIAVYDVGAYCTPTAKLHLLEQGSPQLYYRVMEKLHGHLREADLWISEFSTGPIKSRVARLINFLSRLQYGNSSVNVKLLTCDEMATVLGVTPESVSRFLAEFKRKGILRSLSKPSSEVYECNVKELELAAQE